MYEELPESIEIAIREPLGVDRPAFPVTVGVPFPQGVIERTEELRIEIETGPLTLQARPMLTWPDGSIRWALLDFQVDLARSEERRCQLTFGGGIVPGPPPNGGVAVSQSPSGLEICSGDLRCSILKGAALPFASLVIRGREILQTGSVASQVQIDGRKYLFKATEDLVLDEPGPLRVVVRAEGKAIADDGTTSFDATVRIYAYANHPTLRIFFTITNRIPQEKVNVEAFQVDFHPSFNGPASGFLVSSIETMRMLAAVDELVDGRRSLRIPLVDSQVPSVTTSAFSTGSPEKLRRAAPQYIVEPESEDADPRLRAQADWVTLLPAAAVLGDGETSLTAACYRPWHNAPKEVSIGKNGVQLHLYPLWAGPLEWFRGVAKTHELVLDFREGDIDKEERIHFAGGNEKRPSPQIATRNWMVDTKAFGPVFRYQPEKYPWWEFCLRSACRSLGWNAESQHDVGASFFDFGDTWRPGRGGQWMNNEMDTGYGLILQMIRTGYAPLMENIEAIIHHMIDVDTIHDAEESLWIGGQRYHSAKHGAARGPALCHEWLEGPLYYYLLTGYRRAEEVAQARAAHLCEMIESGAHRIKEGIPRVQGYPLMALARMFDAYRDERYGAACDDVVDWLRQWKDEDGGLWYPSFSVPGGTSIVAGGLGEGIATNALMRCHQFTENEKSWELLKEVADFSINGSGLFTPEGFILKINHPFRDYYEPEPDFYLEALGYLTQKTGDRSYAELGYRNLQRLFVERDAMRRPLGDGHFFRYWLPALALFDQLDMLRDPQPPV